jgi:hypothetical protein
MTGGVQNGDDGSLAEEEVDFEFAQATIREFWGKIKAGRDLGRLEVREVLMLPKEGESREEKDAAVRMWCEVLRLRG